MAEQSKFDPSKPGALRVLHGPRWKLEMDFAQPTLDMLDAGEHLRPFEKEKAPDYNFRKFMSCPLDMIPDGLSIRQDNIFREPPARKFDGSPYKELIQRLVNDADSQGTSLDKFMADVLWSRNSNGVDIVTQMTDAPEGVEVKTQQDAIDADLRPFFLQFTPLQKVDWATTGARKYEWVRYSLGEKPPPTETAPCPNIKHFLSLTATTWTLWEQSSKSEDDKDKEAKIVNEGEHTLGIVPAIKFYFSESKVPGEGGVPLALISRAAVIARCALNLKSQADIDILAAIPRWMMAGITGDKAPDAIGPMMVWTTEDSDATFSVVQAGPESIKEKREWLVLYLNEILRLLKFRGGMGDTEGNQGSGIKLALEMTDLRNELTSTAADMESLELEMMRQAVVMATGDEIAPEDAAEKLKYQVKYNTQFVLDSAMDLLEQMEKWFITLGDVAELVPTVGSSLLEKFRNLNIRDDDPRAQDAQEEIDAVADAIMPAEDTTPVEAE